MSLLLKRCVVDERIMEVARSIRPYLGDLVGARVTEVDQQVAVLLERGRAGDDVDATIIDLLNGSPGTRNWAASMLADPELRPPELQGITEKVGTQPGYSGLANPHGGGVVSAAKFVCPVDGNYAWWRPAVGRPVPCCPDHPDRQLVEA
jgi:hypothetical protein